MSIRGVSPPDPDAATTVATTGTPFIFVAERLWLDFVNTDDLRRGTRIDMLRDFDMLMRWLLGAGVLAPERVATLVRRARQQPAGATAALVEARRLRAALRVLAERGPTSQQVRAKASVELNRVLGRSAGTRRVEGRNDGSFRQSFVPAGDAFSGLMIPVAESAAESLVNGELVRVRRCASEQCSRVFYDSTRNARRRWCTMASCGNRVKAARFRARERQGLQAAGDGTALAAESSPDVTSQVRTA